MQRATKMETTRLKLTFNYGDILSTLPDLKNIALCNSCIRAQENLVLGRVRETDGHLMLLLLVVFVTGSVSSILTERIR